MPGDNEHTFTVDFASGARHDLGEIRRRKQAFMPDGKHAWAISTVFALEDPEQSMEKMELSEENFIGVTDIHCLICGAGYTSAKRHHKCPQALPEQETSWRGGVRGV